MQANLILSLKTSKFEAMTKFFSGIGLVVQEGDVQLLPLFGDGRGARVRRGDFEFNLEESHSTQNQAELYLTHCDYSNEEIEQTSPAVMITNTEPDLVIPTRLQHRTVVRS